MATKRKYSMTALAYDKRGRLVAIGKNSYHKTHPLQKSLALRAGKPNKIFLHAEIDAIVKAKGRPIYKMVVLGYNSNGKAVRSKPCSCCMIGINDYGIKHVEHT